MTLPTIILLSYERFKIDVSTIEIKKKKLKFWIGKALFKGEKIKICVEKVKFKVGKSS